jgi:MYXO-CTERM domain-containing protein
MTKRMQWTRLFLGLMGGWLLATSAVRAQELKPYFLVVVDTSGSMEWCADGDSDCSCHVGDNCGNAYIQNRCGFDSNRLGDAKCSLQRIIDGTGDAVFGLMHFKHHCSNTCDPSIGGSNSCSDTDGELLVEIEENNSTLMREWVDDEDHLTDPSDCQGMCSLTDSGNAGTYTNLTRELTTGRGTPIGDSLFRANQYLRGSVAIGDNWPYPTNPDGFNESPASPIADDPQLACRPVSVILLTDGDNSCGRLPVDPTNDTSSPNYLAGPAKDLNTGSQNATTPAAKAFKTYVIAFGNSITAPDVMDKIALAGGTDAPGADRFFAATNEAQLSAALNQIIADSQAPAETCNMMDDDCDGEVDEGLPKYCDKPNGMNSKYTCEKIVESLCDGKDDDCDGKIDEDFPMQCSTCTSSTTEVCDGVDNDCDQKVDEGASTMESCGTGKGECEPGMLYCVDGTEACQGEVGPSKETCDCKDNNCDGTIDEDSGDGLCGNGARCVGCECLPFCDATAEFAATCAGGRTPQFQDNGECLCIIDTCNLKECQASTIMRGEDVGCAPADAAVGVCQCKAGKCIAPCDGVMCATGEICNPRTGGCVEDSCRGLGCSGDEICEPASGECMKDPCLEAECGDDEVCRDGKCEASCAQIFCGDGRLCQGGKCVEDRCADSACGDDETCNPDSGKCVDDLCVGMTCKEQQVCAATTGECVADPCWNVTCPKSQTCTDGECFFGGTKPVQPSREDGRTRLVATGGGGCACSVPGPAQPGSSGRALLLGLVGLVLAWRRRRSSIAGALAVAALASLAALTTGCRVTPFCVDCAEKAPSSSDIPDGAVVLPDGRVVLPEADGGAPDLDSSVTPDLDAEVKPPGCENKTDEVCNDKDDDCDFKVDEGALSKKNTCLLLGVCGGTLPLCNGGKFVCRYSSRYEKDEATCDGKDNDCDGIVDEGFDKLGDNCTVGIGECRVTGSYECNGSGTDVVCLADTIKDPQDELCDRKDNDCDGRVDEPMATPGKNPSYVDETDPSVMPELCDGIDNDCDGVIDEPKTMPGGNPSYVVEDVVQVNGSLYVYKYEASRVDATATKQGDLAARPCSREGVLPWTNITYEDAVEACEAAGMELCAVADWVDACEGGSGSCGWSFTPASGSCNDYQSMTNGSNDCNGHDVTAEPGDPITDELKPTGSMPLCYADFTGGDIFDLSGNAKEWTTGPDSPTQNPLRGGSFNNSPTGLRCDFDFAVGGPDAPLPSIGFRCCSSTAP